jgi:hypothetical protein
MNRKTVLLIIVVIAAAIALWRLALSYKKQKPTQTMDVQTARIYYLQLAVQYHIAARYAAFSRFSYACGILFHHAVEMYLKGYLRLTLSDKQLRQLGHNLTRTWKKFKKAISQTGPNPFDETIKTLDKHESLRYPEGMLISGTTAVTMLIDFSRSASSQSSVSTTNKTTDFRLHVGDLDALAKFILEQSHVNPPFLTQGLNDFAQEFLKRDNKSQIWV